MTSGDWLPTQASFDLVRRGYSPEQVTAHLERLEYDLRITTANRDATNQRLTELGAQLAAAQAQADLLRSQLDRIALEPVSMVNLSDRMQRTIRLAEGEASEIRARAESDADRVRGQTENARAEAAELRAAFDAERGHGRKQLAKQIHGLIGEAAAEAEETRNLAKEEAGLLLREAHSEAERTIVEAQASASQELADASAGTAALVRDTAAVRERLDAQSLARRTQIDEDFEISIRGRRQEAARVLTDRGDRSAATAAKLVADAQLEAELLAAGAAAESDRFVQQATAYSSALVNRSSAESHHRVTDAERAVVALQALRARVLAQMASLAGHLDHIRELAGSAPSFLDPPEAEQDRAKAANFPAEPAGRPIDVGIAEPVYAPEGAPSERARRNGTHNADQVHSRPSGAQSAGNRDAASQPVPVGVGADLAERADGSDPLGINADGTTGRLVLAKRPR